MDDLRAKLLHRLVHYMLTLSISLHQMLEFVDFPLELVDFKHGPAVRQLCGAIGQVRECQWRLVVVP